MTFLRSTPLWMMICLVCTLSGCTFHEGFFVSGIDAAVPGAPLPFVEPMPVAQNTTDIPDNPDTPSDDFSFLLFTDPHFTRPDSGVYYATEAFKAWLEDKNNGVGALDLEFAICLGDVTDDSFENEYATYKQFVEYLDEHGLKTFAIMGNHDNRGNGPDRWKTHVGLPYYYRLEHKGVSFYMMDTSYRTFGKKQLRYLQQAIANDPNRKIFCTHYPLYGKPDLVYFTLADTRERNLILSLMGENNVGMYFAGHHHKGDVIARYNEGMTEFITGAFHGRDSIFEGPARWYVCSYSRSDGTMGITRYTKYDSSPSTNDIETTEMGTFRFAR